MANARKEPGRCRAHKEGMRAARYLLLPTLAVILVSLLCACSRPPARTKGDPGTGVVLESPDSEKSVEAGTEPTFPVVMWSQAQENASLRIRLDTVAGAQWRTALCIQELCLIHDGESELDEVLELDLEEKTDLEVKMLVPKDAQPGDTKTVLLELSVVGGAGKPGSISLKGTMP